MIRSITLAVLACATLCAAAVVRSIERAIDWVISGISAQPPAFAFSSEPVRHEGFGGFIDPQVERHEAGMSRRSAARHI